MKESAFGVVAPQLFAAGGIHRIHITPGSRGVHDAIDHQRRGLLAALRLAQIVAPGKTQLLDIAGVDRGQWGKVRAVLVAAAGKPVLRLGVRGLQARRIDVSRAIGGRVAERWRPAATPARRRPKIFLSARWIS